MSRKRPLLLTIIVVFVSAIMLAAIYFTLSVRHDERQLAALCRDVKQGMSLESLHGRTAKSELVIEPSKSPRDAGKLFYITHTNLILGGGSFCGVYSDGKTITRVSYNPWYH